MIDINNTLDLIKLKFYNEWLYVAHIYEEGESEFHKQLTQKVIAEYVDPLNLPKDSVIMDLGCGVGYFLDFMKEKGYTNLTGVTLTPNDVKICKEKGHNIKQYDMSFLPQKDGWWDESVDFIFLRHALEHSPYPIFSLMEYNRVLKQGGKMYIEMPAPELTRKHELNPNHYSVLGITQLSALLDRTGFKIDIFNSLEFDLTVEIQEDGTKLEEREKYFCIVVTKTRPLDIK